MPDTATTAAQGFTVQAPTTEYQKVERVKRQNNTVRKVSPYHFYPDTRIPLERFQEGEFCSVEHSETKMSLKKLEAGGAVVGLFDKLNRLLIVIDLNINYHLKMFKLT